MKKAIVIGAGIGGIASALRLVKKGYEVTVFDSNHYPGGKITSFKLGKYRFDAGPPLLTMPNLIDDLFLLFDENPSDSFNYKRKKISCKYFWDDKTEITAYANKNLFFKEIQNKLNIDTNPLKIYLEEAKKKFDLTFPIFLEKSLHKFSNYLSWNTLKALKNFMKYEINKDLHSVNIAQLKEPHLVQMYDRYATYNGSSPFKTPGIMTLVQHLEQEFGTYIPEKGMHQITNSLFELAVRKGVNFNLGKKVEKIITEKNKAVGVKINERIFKSDVIISNMDIYPTYKYLLNGVKAPNQILKREKSSSAVIFYWGIKNKFDKLDLHNVFFSDNYKSEFDAIFNKKTPANDFTIYINITSKDVPSDSPNGSENWFVMINTPADSGQNWEKIVNELRKKTIIKLNRILKVDLETMIEEEKVLTPPIIEKRTSSHRGALYGSSSNDKLAAFLRHPNFSSKIKNLYFCGGSVHPGGGIPLCLLSAKIATDLIPQVREDSNEIKP